MEVRYRHYFLEALTITALIFLVGFLLGIRMETARNEELKSYYQSSESEINEIILELNSFEENFGYCEEILQKNFDIAERIYEQAVLFEKYEESTIFTEKSLIEEHKKFDYMRTLFWINSIKMKKNCPNNTMNTLAYLYDYRPKKNKEVIEQRKVSAIARNTKSKLGSELVLIPIAKNVEILELDDLLKNMIFLENVEESAFLIANEEILFLSNQSSDLNSYFNIDY